MRKKLVALWNAIEGYLEAALCIVLVCVAVAIAVYLSKLFTSMMGV